MLNSRRHHSKGGNPVQMKEMKGATNSSRLSIKGRPEKELENNFQKA